MLPFNSIFTRGEALHLGMLDTLVGVGPGFRDAQLSYGFHYRRVTSSMATVSFHGVFFTLNTQLRQSSTRPNKPFGWMWPFRWLKYKITSY